MSRFHEFWSVWPKGQRKVAKDQCEVKWKARNLDRIADEIVGHVEWSKRHNQTWIDGMVPLPMTYINQSRWQAGRDFDEKLQRARPKTVTQIDQEEKEGIVYSRWARYANQVLFQLAYKDIGRGFRPVGDDLKQVLELKARIVSDAEKAADEGDPFDDEDYKDIVYTSLTEALAASGEAL